MIIDEIMKEKLVERLISRTDKANELFLQEIGKLINKVRQKKSVDYLDSYYKVINKINKITSDNVLDIYKILIALATEIKRDTKEFYEYRGIEFTQFEKDKINMDYVMQIANDTAREYQNSMASSILGTALLTNNKVQYRNLYETYQHVANEAEQYNGLSEEEYYQQLNQMQKQIGQNGIKTIDYSKRRSLAIGTATSLILMNSMRQTNNDLNERFGIEFGANGLEIIPHSHPAPDHAPYQRKAIYI